MEINEYLELDPEAERIACGECGEDLCDARDNYKEHTALRTGPLTDAGPVFDAPEEIYEDPPDIEFRQFFCPNCATLFDYEIALKNDPILHDVEIDLDKLSD